MPKLAIIIPYYKIAFFKDTLVSLENQTCKDFSLYIGNDCSPDDPLKLIEEILQKTAYHYKRYSKNLGGENLVAQWERVIDESADEEWIMILGDDDVISENFVEEFYNNMKSAEGSNCNVIKFSQCWIDEQGIQLNDFTCYAKLIDPSEHLGYKILNAERSSLSEHIFRKKQLAKIKFKDFPLGWGADDVAVFEISQRNPIYFINEAKVYVRVSNENISGRRDNLDKKKNAKITFEKYLIKNHYRCLTKETLKKLVDQQIYYRYHDNLPLGFSLFKAYLHLRLYRKILTLPKTFLILNKIIK
ncbi:MAG: glycosyltransferase family 2 protein [Kaistella sp.]